ncbi:hypothetical protein A2769_02910 [Candidatus Daviesbacteria bacterium RIFCSPHIGHO2_01_FULL_37_27]|nr:MAG: hypothetical protein A2769_02910 [Candidatus Daviesbacteria bacterium RIFCSPHIGHO2_01_FULL_37_27]
MKKVINTPYIKRVKKPWGYELHFTPDNLPYMGKILHINAGKRVSLQIHDKKMESWYKLSGKVIMILGDNEGNLFEQEMEKGVGYTTKINQKHRLKALEDSDILEVSTPEIGTTFRLEDDYARTDETEEVRRDPQRGWKP